MTAGGLGTGKRVKSMAKSNRINEDANAESSMNGKSLQNKGLRDSDT